MFWTATTAMNDLAAGMVADGLVLKDKPSAPVKDEEEDPEMAFLLSLSHEQRVKLLKWEIGVNDA